jgi:transposase
MASKKRQVIGGVDTHGKTHHAAVIDHTGRLHGDQEFPATAAGYQELLRWLRSFGRLVKVGVEGTGTCGAGLARHLTAQRVDVVEVDRPDRKTRRSKGKSDPIDAIAAARAALSGQAAALAHLCGAAPIPVSSGRTDRHRLNRGGDRAANNSLYVIALCRMRYDPRTKAYVDRRTQQGRTKKETIRCLKRYIAREVHTALLTDLQCLTKA